VDPFFKYDFAELLPVLEALKAFNAPPSHLGVSSIEDEFRQHIRDVEEENLQIERDVGLLPHENDILCGANLRFSVRNRTQKKETDALHKQPEELVARFGRRNQDLMTHSRAFCRISGHSGN
jgi:hypothetical protein